MILSWIRSRFAAETFTLVQAVPQSTAGPWSRRPLVLSTALQHLNTGSWARDCLICKRCWVLAFGCCSPMCPALLSEHCWLNSIHDWPDWLAGLRWWTYPLLGPAGMSACPRDMPCGSGSTAGLRDASLWQVMAHVAACCMPHKLSWAVHVLMACSC